MSCLVKQVRKRRGQSLLEFSLVAVITMFTLLTFVEVSRMVLVSVSVANAALAGVRYACVHGSSRTGTGSTGPSGPSSNPPQVVSVVKNFASPGLLTTSNLLITVTYPGGSNTPGHAVIVKVVYPYDSFISYFRFTPRLGSLSEGVISY